MTDEQLHELMEAHKHYSAAAEVFKSAHEQIRRLRAERDEARREVLEKMHLDLRKGYAAARGWDCLKEER